MSFLKEIFRGDPIKSAAKHEKRARNYQEQGNDRKAADEWAAAGRDHARIPDYKRAHEAYLQAAQFYLADKDINREKSILEEAIDVALLAGDYPAAANALTQITRLGTRTNDEQLLLRAYALQTIIYFVGNDLARARETFREAKKIEKRLGSKEVKTLVYPVASILVNRFIKGNSVIEPVQLPSRFNESEQVNQLLLQCLSLFNDMKDSSLKLVLDKDEVKIKDRVSGSCRFNFSIPVRILDIRLFLPSNIASLEALKWPDEPKRKYKVSFAIEPRLSGNYEIGPLQATLQVESQQFQLKSNIVPIQIAAAKPRIEVSAQPSTSPYSQEEFELILRLENNSHGDASNVTITVTLPSTLLLKTGTLEKRIITLPPQQYVQFPLYLIATKAGTHEGTIDCKYSGLSGRSQSLENKFTVEVLARPRKEKD
jgi:tetratricopeptide (TPR) repeat protein